MIKRLISSIFSEKKNDLLDWGYESIDSNIQLFKIVFLFIFMMQAIDEVSISRNVDY